MNMDSGGMMHWVITGVAALATWALTKNLDGPIVHYGLTALVAYLVWSKMANAGG